MADPAAAAPAPEASSSSPTPETNDNGNAASTIGDHPSLQPALHLQITIGPATPIGSVSRGTPLTVVPLVAGTLVSEPGFPLHVNASMRGQGVDYVHNDPDGGRMRLKSDLVVGDRQGETIHISYTGIVDITNEMRRILGRSSNARSTDFGNSFINVSFETGSMRYKSLEQSLFVGAGRFIVDDGGLKVEYRISKVCR